MPRFHFALHDPDGRYIDLGTTERPDGPRFPAENLAWFCSECMAIWATARCVDAPCACRVLHTRCPSHGSGSLRHGLDGGELLGLPTYALRRELLLAAELGDTYWSLHP